MGKAAQILYQSVNQSINYYVQARRYYYQSTGLSMHQKPSSYKFKSAEIMRRIIWPQFREKN